MPAISGAIFETGRFQATSGPSTFQAVTVAGDLRLNGNRIRNSDNESILFYQTSVIEIGGTGAYSLVFKSGGATVFSVSATGALAATVFDQGAGDGEILTLRSTDVAHGMTSLTATSTYGSAAKGSATDGGLLFRGFSEALTGLSLEGLATTEQATRSTSATGPISLNALLKSGTTAAGLAADRNLVVIGNNGTTRFIFDSDGDSHQDVGTAWTNFDSEDDVRLLNLMSAHVTRADDQLRDSFRGWLEQSREELERIRLVAFNDDGHHFVNMSRLQMLTVGAVRQIAERLERIEQRLNLLPG